MRPAFKAPAESLFPHEAGSQVQGSTWAGCPEGLERPAAVQSGPELSHGSDTLVLLFLPS